VDSKGRMLLTRSANDSTFSSACVAARIFPDREALRGDGAPSRPGPDVFPPDDRSRSDACSGNELRCLIPGEPACGGKRRW